MPARCRAGRERTSTRGSPRCRRRRARRSPETYAASRSISPASSACRGRSERASSPRFAVRSDSGAGSGSTESTERISGPSDRSGVASPGSVSRRPRPSTARVRVSGSTTTCPRTRCRSAASWASCARSVLDCFSVACTTGPDRAPRACCTSRSRREPWRSGWARVPEQRERNRHDAGAGEGIAQACVGRRPRERRDRAAGFRLRVGARGSRHPAGGIHQCRRPPRRGAHQPASLLDGPKPHHVERHPRELRIRHPGVVREVHQPRRARALATTAAIS